MVLLPIWITKTDHQIPENEPPLKKRGKQANFENIKNFFFRLASTSFSLQLIPTRARSSSRLVQQIIFLVHQLHFVVNFVHSVIGLLGQLYDALVALIRLASDEEQLLRSRGVTAQVRGAGQPVAVHSRTQSHMLQWENASGLSCSYFSLENLRQALSDLASFSPACCMWHWTHCLTLPFCCPPVAGSKKEKKKKTL